MTSTALGLPASSLGSLLLLPGALLSRELLALAPKQTALQFTDLLFERLNFPLQLLDPANPPAVEFPVTVGLLPQADILLPQTGILLSQASAFLGPVELDDGGHGRYPNKERALCPAQNSPTTHPPV